MTDRPITLFHAPRTRSTGVLALLEELGAPYTLERRPLGEDGTASPAFLAINPLGKVPTLQDGSAIVTEQVAIFIHLADLFPAAGLAPAVTDQMRGPYLRWLVFYAAAFEPAVVDKARGHEPGHRAMSPYGNYDAVIETLADALEPGPYLLGSTLSAADILWGIALSWMMQFKLVPARPPFVAYASMITERPGVRRAREIDDAMAA